MTIIPFFYFHYYYYYYNSNCYAMHFQIYQQILYITDNQCYNFFILIWAYVLPTHYIAIHSDLWQRKKKLQYIRYPARGSNCTLHVNRHLENGNFEYYLLCVHTEFLQPYLIVTHVAYGKKNNYCWFFIIFFRGG